MAHKQCLNVSCKNCKYYSKETKTITRHPTSSSCVWIDKTVHKCDRLNKIIDNKQLVQTSCNDFYSITYKPN